MFPRFETAKTLNSGSKSSKQTGQEEHVINKVGFAVCITPSTRGCHSFEPILRRVY